MTKIMKHAWRGYYCTQTKITRKIQMDTWKLRWNPWQRLESKPNLAQNKIFKKTTKSTNHKKSLDRWREKRKTWVDGHDVPPQRLPRSTLDWNDHSHVSGWKNPPVPGHKTNQNPGVLDHLHDQPVASHQAEGTRQCSDSLKTWIIRYITNFQ